MINIFDNKEDISELAKLVLELHNQTGRGLFSCKKALLANDMDMDKAKEYLKEYDEIRMITWR